MKRLFVAALAAAALAIVFATACTQSPAAPAAQQTAAPAVAKAAEPTKASVQTQPTAPAAAAAKTINYPEKGRAVTIVVPWAAGSVNDIVARFLGGYLEKEIGTPVEVVAKAGAGSQVGMTDVAKSKPDGYTLGLNSMPTTIILYTDPDKQAVFGRKDLVPVSVLVQEPVLVVVSADSPYKTLKDLVDAAKANPGGMKVADSGLLTPGHLGWIGLGKAAGVKFASVHFNGDSECYTALLGGHVDASVGYSTGVVPQVKSGKMRLLGVMDKEPSIYFPDVKTLPQQGYDANMIVTRGVVAPGGTPKEITDVLSGAIKKIVQGDEFKKKAEEAGLVIKYLDTPEYAKQWDEQEVMIKSVLADAKADK